MRTDDEKEWIREHPCVKNAKKGICGALMDFPHPRVRCSVDEHTALDIVGAKDMLETLYRDCPKKDCDNDE